MSGDLCVFLVDNGSTHEFSVERYVGEQVECLQRGIYEELGIEIENQVLMMENGIQLQSSRKLAQYSCGTSDNNPIFLFSKQTIYSNEPPSASVYNHSFDVAEVQSELERSLSQQSASIDLVQSRTTLVRRIVDLDQKLSQATSSLVRDQKLQHQGWMAVVANLEKYTESFLDLCDMLFADIDQSGDIIQRFHQLVSQFPETVRRLKAVQLPSVLTKDLVSCTPSSSTNSDTVFTSPNIAPSSCSTNGSTLLNCDSRDQPTNTLSLYDFLVLQNGFFDLENRGPQLQHALNGFSEDSLHYLRGEVEAIVTETRREEMKKIRNFSNRIADLDVQMKKSESLVSKQTDYLKAFVMHNERMNSVGDRSVLVDLCRTHAQFLREVSETHNKVLQINNSTKKSKDELAHNLHTRLKWIMKMQRKIVDCESEVLMRRESLKRLGRVQLMEQTTSAPEYAVQILVEAHRRSLFSSAFLQWGKPVGAKAKELLTEELNRRLEFTKNTSQHFLYSLFPFLWERFPVETVLRCPDFDIELPVVSKSEIDAIAKNLPELNHLCTTNTTCIDFGGQPFANVEKETCDKEMNTSSLEIEQNEINGNEVQEVEDWKQYSTMVANDAMESTEARAGKIASLCEQIKAILRQDSCLESNNSVETSLESLAGLMKSSKEETTSHEVQRPLMSDASCGTELQDENARPNKFKESSVDAESQTSDSSTTATVIPASASDGVLSQSFHIQAENQASFNAALSALSREKNGEIIKLRAEIRDLKEKLKKCKTSQTEEKAEATFELELESSLGSTITTSNTHEFEASTESKPTAFSQSLDSTRNTGMERTDSVVVVSQPKAMINSDPVVFESQVTETVNQKEESEQNEKKMSETLPVDVGQSENSNPVPRLSPVACHQIKVALNEFRTNDLVLILFDSLSGHYKLFSVTNTPYFLHEECYAELGITTQSISPEERKHKILAVFVNKEYCKVRKPNNRFNLEMGRKFYRVRVVMWRRPATEVLTRPS